MPGLRDPSHREEIVLSEPEPRYPLISHRYRHFSGEIAYSSRRAQRRSSPPQHGRGLSQSRVLTGRPWPPGGQHPYGGSCWKSGIRSADRRRSHGAGLADGEFAAMPGGWPSGCGCRVSCPKRPDLGAA